MSQNRDVFGEFDDLLMNFTRLATQLFRDMLVKLGKFLMKKNDNVNPYDTVNVIIGYTIFCGRFF
jgi:hypothetical protein